MSGKPLGQPRASPNHPVYVNLKKSTHYLKNQYIKNDLNRTPHRSIRRIFVTQSVPGLAGTVPGPAKPYPALQDHYYTHLSKFYRCGDLPDPGYAPGAATGSPRRAGPATSPSSGPGRRASPWWSPRVVGKPVAAPGAYPGSGRSPHR